MRNQKEQLYRKVNTIARGVHHNFGGNFSNERNSKGYVNSESNRIPMHSKTQRGLDYTPLYRFLLSKVGKNWADVHKEAVSRLDKEEPIYHLVARNENEKQDKVRCGESSYYSGLFVDENNLLQKVNPNLGVEDVNVTCGCCTFTFNGSRVSKKYNPPN